VLRFYILVKIITPKYQETNFKCSKIIRGSIISRLCLLVKPREI